MNDGLEVSSTGFELVEIGEAHGASEPVVAVESGMMSRYLVRFVELDPLRRLVSTYGWADGRLGVSPGVALGALPPGREMSLALPRSVGILAGMAAQRSLTTTPEKPGAVELRAR